MMTYREGYAVGHLVEALRSAREARGLSQRALGAATGIPQSHISRIEAGTVDVQLSSLLTLARHLDLDVVLVPRALLPGVEAIKRRPGLEPVADADSTKRASAELARIDEAARTLSIPHGSGPLRRLRKEAGQLSQVKLGPPEFETIRQVARSVRNLPSDESAVSQIQRAALTLKRLRNNLAIRPSGRAEAQRAAHTLDDEDDDA